MVVASSLLGSLMLMVNQTVKQVLTDHIMVGVSIEARTKMSDIAVDVSSLSTEELK